ncbi:hypothetical protein [Streptomyces sp. XY006]|uniref:hypothetical protein n=1 Tax=Streptomyces sp. XY006 TaxID=2021410 RepID=UPI0015C5DB6A|nr:hypothetical protein [Streptomyces sp. XY006]
MPRPRAIRTEADQVEVLLLSRHLPHEHLVTGPAAALKTGALTADALALEAPKSADAEIGRADGAAAAPPRRRKEPLDA